MKAPTSAVLALWLLVLPWPLLSPGVGARRRFGGCFLWATGAWGLNSRIAIEHFCPRFGPIANCPLSHPQRLAYVLLVPALTGGGASVPLGRHSPCSLLPYPYRPHPYKLAPS